MVQKKRNPRKERGDDASVLQFLYSLLADMLKVVGRSGMQVGSQSCSSRRSKFLGMDLDLHPETDGFIEDFSRLIRRKIPTVAEHITEFGQSSLCDIREHSFANQSDIGVRI